MVIEVASEGTDTIQTSLASYTLGSIDPTKGGSTNNYVENLSYTGTLAFSGTGNELDNSITSGNGADTLSGGAGSDTLVSGSGNDVLSGGTGNDSMDGGLNTDRVDYSYLIDQNASFTLTRTNDTTWIGSAASNDIDTLLNFEAIKLGLGFNTVLLQLQTTAVTIDGASGASNTIASGAGNDSLLGGIGADSLSGGLGNDSINGGSDTNAGLYDWADYSYVGVPSLGGTSGQTTGIAVVLSGTGGTVTAAGTGDTDRLFNIENVMGSKNADSFVGDSMGNYFKGGLGNDTFSGGAGNDTLDGNGSSQTDVGSAVDTASYAYLTTSTSGVSIVLNKGSGTASVSASDIDILLNIENIIGGSGNDTIGGDDNANTLSGGSGNDSFIASFGSDSIDGGANTDIVDYSAITAAGYYESVSGSGSNVTITKYNSAGVSVGLDTLINVEFINGLSFAPANTTAGINANLSTFSTGFGLAGTSYADTFIGGTGNDVFNGGAGNDSIDGGGGNDIADYSYATTGLTITLNLLSVATTVTVNSTTDVDTLVNIEGLITGKGNDVITNAGYYGTPLNYFSVNTGKGNDTIIAGYGSYQTIDGGSDTDTFDTSKLTSYGVYIDLSQNKWGGYRSYLYDQGGMGYNKIFNVENIIGTASDDSIIGDSNSNYIFGGGGNETIVGGLGSDTLDGGAGSDIVSFAYLTNSSPDLSINLNSTTVVAGVTYQYQTVNNGGSIDQIMNFEGVFAGGGNDTLIGNGSANTFSGGAGNNSIDGGAGNDIVDYSWIAAGSNFTVDTTGTNWTVTVTDSSGNNTITSDTLVGIEGFIFGNITLPTSINLSSTTAALTFSGSAGSDIFIGGKGNDSVNVGFGGSDTLDGGLGNDTLVLAASLSTIYNIETVTMVGQSGTMTGAVTGSTVQFSNFEYIKLTNTNSANSTSLGDKFIGSSTTSNVYVYGWDGNDTLDDGGGSGMTLDGQTDNDVYFIRSSFTQINEWTALSSGYGTVDLINTTLTSVDLSNVQYGSGNQIENLTYLDAKNSGYDSGSGTWATATLGSGDFTGLGNEMNNRITGGFGNNSLVGGAGSDTLIGNSGNDVLRGGDIITGTDSATNRTNTLNNWSSNTASLSVTKNITGIIAPDGSQTVSSVMSLPTTDNIHYLYSSTIGTTAATANYQLTAYFKANTNYLVQIAFNNGSNNINFTSNSWINVDLRSGLNASGTLGSTLATNSSVYAAGSGGGTYSGTYSVIYDATTGWYRVSLTAVLVAGSSGTFEFVALSDKNNLGFLPSVTGNNNSFYVWNPTLTAVDGADSLVGGGGNDTLQGGNGNDTMDGGGGTGVGGVDVADYSYLATGVTLNLANFNQTTLQAVSIAVGDVDSVMNFEGLIGGAGSDSLIGDGKANYLAGGLGGDTIDGLGGNDTLDGGAGNDMLSFASATAGISVSLANSSMSGGGYNATYYNFEGLIGSKYSDTLVGTSASETFDGGADTSGDSIVGGGGTDWLSYDSLAAGAGVIVTLGTYNNASMATGGAGTDTLNGTFVGVIGSQNTDSLIGTAANETFDGGRGATNDSISGGGGVDWLSYASLNAGLGVFVTLGTYSSFALATGGAGTDTLTGTFGGVIGSQYSDSLVGSLANETFDGGVGTANDTIVGGGGIDWLSYASLNGGQGVTMTLSNYSTTPALLYTVGAGNDSLSGTFQGIIGSIYADSILGSSNNESIFGGAGNDTIDSGKGSSESLDGGAGFDFLSFTTTTGAVSVSLGNNTMSGGGYVNLSYTNFEGILGSFSTDSLIGDMNANYIYGNGGNDTILGGLGADTIQGGTGSDSLDGNGNGSADSANIVDVVDYSYASSGLTITLNNSTAPISVTVTATTDIDTIQNFEGILGGSGADSFTGDNQNNYLAGGAGNDTLNAIGSGSDTLFGGTGNDVLKLDWSSLNLSNIDGGAGNDTVSFAGSSNMSLNFTASSFTGILTNVEQIDFSTAGTSSNATITMDGAGIQKLLGGAVSTSAFAGVLDIKLLAGQDTLILANNANYTYWSSSSVTSTASLSAGTISLNGLSTTGADIYVFDSTHTTLLADLHYHT